MHTKHNATLFPEECGNHWIVNWSKRNHYYKQFEELRRRFSLSTDLKDGVALHAIKSSMRILKIHLYN